MTHTLDICGKRALRNLCIALAIAPSSNFALATRILNQDATAAGRGNAFVATADNPSAIYYNPAGLTQLEGLNFEGNSIFYPHSMVDHYSPSGVHTENEPSPHLVPQMYSAFTPKGKPYSFGLGIHTPFGRTSEYPRDSIFRTAIIESELKFISINPVAAWKLHDTFSIGAGPTFNYSELRLEQGLNPAPFELHYDGKGWSYGFNAGVLWQPHPEWSFGARYMSQTSVGYRGKVSVTPRGPATRRASASLDYPQIITAGVSYRPNPKWNLEVNVDWADWSVVKSVAIEGLPPTPLNWKPSMVYNAGATYDFNARWFGSIGYAFAEDSSRTETYTPGMIDMDFHFGNVGVGFRGEHWRFALTAQLAVGQGLDVNNARNPTVNGRFEFMAPVVITSWGYHF